MDAHGFVQETLAQFQAGDEIMRSEPWIYQLRPQLFDEFCYHCIAPFHSPLSDKEEDPAAISCPTCGFVKYCSSQCQLKDDAERHGEECHILGFLKSEITDLELQHDVLLMLKAIWKINKGHLGGPKAICQFPSERDFSCLLSHKEDIQQKPALVNHIGKLQKILAKILGTNDCLQTDRLTEIYGKVKINSFDIRDDYLKRVGEGVYFGPSVFDHSCQRNAIFYFEGRNIVIKAISDIPSFDDVRLAYCDPFAPKKIRQKHLKDWYFTCSCGLCSEATEADLNCISCSSTGCDEPRPLDDRGMQACPKCGTTSNQPMNLEAKLAANKVVFGSTADEAKQRVDLSKRLVDLQLKQLMQIDELRDNCVNSIDSASKCLMEMESGCRRILDTSQLLFHPTNLMLGVTFETLGQVLLAQRNDTKYSEALDCLQKAVAPMRRICAPKDPRLGLQLLTVAILQLHSSQTLAAEISTDCATESERIFGICNGKDRPLATISRRIKMLTEKVMESRELRMDTQSIVFVEEMLGILTQTLFSTLHAVSISD